MRRRGGAAVRIAVWKAKAVDAVAVMRLEAVKIERLKEKSQSESEHEMQVSQIKATFEAAKAAAKSQHEIMLQHEQDEMERM